MNRPDGVSSILKTLGGSTTKWLRNRFAPKLPLADIYRYFKEVLESNNHALELITDMGQKLDGSYIFDINYIKRIYPELADTLRTSIERFNRLTRNNYAIEPAFTHIDSLISEMIYGEGTTGDDSILFLDDVQWFRAREVGGKSFHLSELKNNLHLNIPDTFVLTTRAYDEFLQYNRLKEIMQPAEGRQPDAKAVQDAVMAGSFPPRLEEQLDKILQTMHSRHGAEATLAVRSSAEEEDDLFSFAGQFETILNVPIVKEDVIRACKRVYASLFDPNALAYQERLDYAFGGLRMAIGCVLQIDPVASGVIYTANPVSGNIDEILINATWGLGTSVVDGTIDVDNYVVERGKSPRIRESKVGSKEYMNVLDTTQPGKIKEIPTPDDKKNLPCLPPALVLELAEKAAEIEKYFRTPQDIEWALDAHGSIFLLQSRPLKIVSPQVKADLPHYTHNTDSVHQPFLFKKPGVVVQKGIAAGNVYVLHRIDELDNFPKGAILVAHSDSPHFIRIMPFVAAIITDTGSVTSHMASVCREFGIPTIVNTGDATKILQHGGEITLEADESGEITIVNGLDNSILKGRQQHIRRMEELYEYRRQKYILRHIAPLNLVNPLADEFTPAKCRTLHDVLRFIHEKSVQELIAISQHGLFGKPSLLRLDLDVPAGIHVLDIGGGLSAKTKSPLSADDIASLPFKALLKGMTWKGAWNTQAVALNVKDFMGSVGRFSVLASGASGFAENNVAVISKEYINLHMSLGYHFNLVDSYCSEKAANNHIYFRFVGGATDIVKRSRRIKLIDKILVEFGFNINIKGDLLIARLSHVEQEEIIETLTMVGRLIAYARQMDAVLRNENDVELYTRRFLEGNFEFLE
ncbi:MAG TPA: hypothetical protein ENK33_10630 [Desulfobacterales bacterium]|nr:hypothetical protein [Desulfobacterales bacterium]